MTNEHYPFKSPYHYLTKQSEEDAFQDLKDYIILWNLKERFIKS